MPLVGAATRAPGVHSALAGSVSAVIPPAAPSWLPSPRVDTTALWMSFAHPSSFPALFAPCGCPRCARYVIPRRGWSRPLVWEPSARKAASGLDDCDHPQARSPGDASRSAARAAPPLSSTATPNWDTKASLVITPSPSFDPRGRAPFVNGSRQPGARRAEPVPMRMPRPTRSRWRLRPPALLQRKSPGGGAAPLWHHSAGRRAADATSSGSHRGSSCRPTLCSRRRALKVESPAAGAKVYLKAVAPRAAAHPAEGAVDIPWAVIECHVPGNGVLRCLRRRVRRRASSAGSLRFRCRWTEVLRRACPERRGAVDVRRPDLTALGPVPAVAPFAPVAGGQRVSARRGGGGRPAARRAGAGDARRGRGAHRAVGARERVPPTPVTAVSAPAPAMSAAPDAAAGGAPPSSPAPAACRCSAKGAARRLRSRPLRFVAGGACRDTSPPVAPVMPRRLRRSPSRTAARGHSQRPLPRPRPRPRRRRRCRRDDIAAGPGGLPWSTRRASPPAKVASSPPVARRVGR